MVRAVIYSKVMLKQTVATVMRVNVLAGSRNAQGLAMLRGNHPRVETVQLISNLAP